jgi:hypothetical protein
VGVFANPDNYRFAIAPCTRSRIKSHFVVQWIPIESILLPCGCFEKRKIHLTRKPGPLKRAKDCDRI